MNPTFSTMCMLALLTSPALVAGAATAAAEGPCVDVDSCEGDLLAVSVAGDATCESFPLVPDCAAVSVLGDADGLTVAVAPTGSASAGTAVAGQEARGGIAVAVLGPAHGDEVAVSVGGDATCAPTSCFLAASGTGSATCAADVLACVGVAAGDASCTETGAAFPAPQCVTVAGGTASCEGSDLVCLATVGVAGAHGGFVAVAVGGDASGGLVAVSVFGEGSGPVGLSVYRTVQELLP